MRATPEATKTASPAAAAKVQQGLIEKAAELGLASRVPSDVDFCVSSVGLKQHTEALKATRYWKEVLAFLEDKGPAASTLGSKAQVDEMFVAFGKGSEKSMMTLRQLNDLYNEAAYRGMMSGGVLASLGTAFDVKKMLAAALSDEQTLDALILMLERFEMPSIMMGVASPEPAQVLRLISDELHLSEWMGDVPQSRIVTTQGEQITVNEISMSEVLPLKLRQEWIAALVKATPNLAPEVKDRVARGLEVLAQKKWVLALGNGVNRGFVAVAKSKEDIHLANSVEDSMLARPEMRSLDSDAAKNLGLIACWEGGFWDVMQSDQPFMPIVRGLLAGLQSEKMFTAMVRALEPKVAELAVTERAFYHRDHTNGAAVAWLEDGLQMEFAGGLSRAELVPLAVESQFTALLNEPEVVFGMSGLGSTTGNGRVYFEAWMRAAYTAVQELTKAGVGGEKSAGIFKVVDQSMLPSVIGTYEATKTIYQKALGDDGALILDIGGKMPLLPGLPPGGEVVPLPRFVSVHEIKNRVLVGVSWQNIESGLQQALMVIPAPAAEPFKLPPVKSERSRELMSYFYELPFGSKDLVPCASLTEKVFMLGTSRAQHESMLTYWQEHASAVKNTGWHAKVNFVKAREFLKAFAAARAQNDGAAGLKTVLKWMQPFDVLDLRLWNADGEGRGRLSWKMHDVLSYD